MSTYLSKGINPKMNVIVRLEVAYFKAAVQYFIYYTPKCNRQSTELMCPSFNGKPQHNNRLLL